MIQRLLQYRSADRKQNQKGTAIERQSRRRAFLLSCYQEKSWFHNSLNSHWLHLAAFTIIFCVKTLTFIVTMPLAQLLGFKLDVC